MPSPPPFATGRRWQWRSSQSKKIDTRVWYDPTNRYEYEPDPARLRGTWHEINPRTDEYRDVDYHTGLPIAGSEGRWRKLK